MEKKFLKQAKRENQKKPLILKKLQIQRRMYRATSSEMWLVDGFDSKDKLISSVGNLVIFYEGEHLLPRKATAVGAIDYKYEIAMSERELRDFIRDFTLGKLCIPTLYIHDFMHQGGNINGVSWE